ncbi:hypothetical protein C1H46_017075 [Malus baccata]|uniref:Anaphase-promoting complex subunit 4 WD40 domain-containing protein n=1 Tax=Malus baccata TaxID=106549 RepID=A0A540MEZ3_MALBA|nr:hypothetical protein C1H46_017075 [Malus baccata]
MYEKGPFDMFSVGGDMSDANVVKFSDDGRLMLSTTTGGHIHVLDSFRGTLVQVMVVSMLGVFRAGKKSQGGRAPNMNLQLSNGLPETSCLQLDRPNYHFGFQICLSWDLTLEESRNFWSSHRKFLAQSSSKIPLNRQFVSET